MYLVNSEIKSDVYSYMGHFLHTFVSIKMIVLYVCAECTRSLCKKYRNSLSTLCVCLHTTRICMHSTCSKQFAVNIMQKKRQNEEAQTSFKYIHFSIRIAYCYWHEKNLQLDPRWNPIMSNLLWKVRQKRTNWELDENPAIYFALNLSRAFWGKGSKKGF